MKRLLAIVILFLSCGIAMAKTYHVAEIPNVQLENRYRFTSNPDGILSSEAVARIDSICYGLREGGIAQVAVVAIDDIGSDDVFNFAYELFSTWGVGGKNDSGLGIILVESRREIRFITGYAVEGVLPDAICKRIQTRYMLPHFREGDYSSGMVAGLEAISGVLTGSDLTIVEDSDDEGELAIAGFMIFIILMTIGIIILAYRSVHKCPRCKKIGLVQSSSEFISKGMGFATYEDTYVCKYCGGSTRRKRQVATTHSSNRRGGGGPFIGGGFGGGGGSSIGGWGGGSFGGGGAGSRW